MSTRDLQREQARERRLAVERAQAGEDARKRTLRNIGLGMLAVLAPAAVVVAVIAVGTALGIIVGLLLVLVAIGRWAGRRPNMEAEQARETTGATSYHGTGR